MLEYFKRPWAIQTLASSLAASCKGSGLGCELVVNADNPQEAEEWASVAANSSGFVVPVFSSNVHETRGYNRAAKLARGQYLIIWQDDQTAPAENHQWLHDLKTVFDAWPQLAIVGMNTYRLCRHLEPSNRHGQTSWDVDKRTGVSWSFVQYVDFAPLVIRASAYAALGGLDEGFPRSGDCGIWGDWELCNRAWVDGWQVGFFPLPGRGSDGQAGGTHSAANGQAEKCWGRQQLVTSAAFSKRYVSDAFQEELCAKVLRANLDSFTLSDPSQCPYGPTAYTKYGNCTRA